MDTLSYFYPRSTADRLTNNKLRHIKDYVSTPSITADLETQVDDNYLYDNIGNLIRDSKESITRIEWTVYGKIRKITKSGSSLEYAYDPAGNRVYKQETVGSTVNKTWYVRDAQGNVLGVYGNKNGDALTYWKEQHLYGSSRLGMWLPDINIVGGTSSTPWNSPGNRRYELANHLGNVLSTISDAAKVNFFPVVENAQDYYPFGMMQPGRTYDRVAGSSYRYGFNGKENDNEVKGEGNQQDYGFRIYDPRLGRFLSVDPLTQEYPWYTPYQFAGNTPIQAIDIDGLEDFLVQHGIWNKRQAMIKMETDGGIVGSSPTPHYKIPENRPAEIRQDYSRHPFAKSAADAAYHKQLLNQASVVVPYGGVALDLIAGKEPSKLEIAIETATMIPFAKPIMKGADLIGAVIRYSDEAADLAKVAKEGIELVAKEGVSFNKGVLESFTKHAFAGGRHADLGLSVEKMASKGLDLVGNNMSLLKAGDNTLIGNINGIQKSFKAFVKDGKIMSVNMYSGTSNRATQGTIINFGDVTW